MRILYLTQRLPYAPNRGDRLRAWHAIRYLSREHEVTVGSLVHDPAEAAHAGELSGMAREVIVGRVPYLTNRVRGALRLVGSTPLTLSLLDSARLRARLLRRYASERPDLVIAACSSMARFALEAPLADVPLIIDMIDADSAKWRDFAGDVRFPLTWVYRREARTLRLFEAHVMRRARLTLVVNERERRELIAVARDADVRVLPIGVDLERLARPAGLQPRERAVVFCGVMDYGPNADAAVWLAREVWPEVRRRVPEATLYIVGASPTNPVLRQGDPNQGVFVTGTVDDVRPYLWRAAVSVAPLHAARGVQTKVLEALGAGLPSVITPAVEQGLPRRVLAACAVRSTPAEFARAMIDLLLYTPAQRRELVEAAHPDLLGWETQLKLLGAAVVEAAGSRVPPC